MPLALIGLFTTIWAWRPRANDTHLCSWRRDPRHQLLVFWVTWLGCTGGFFTVAQFYNRYYLVMLAPAVCVLAAIGAIGLWQDYQRRGWQSWLLPLAVFATGIEQQAILSDYSNWNPWLSPLVYVTTSIAVFLLLGLRLVRPRPAKVTSNTQRRVGNISIPTIALVVLIVAPLFWLSASFGRGNAGAFPLSGPVSAPSSAASAVDPHLIAYLEAHAGHPPFIVATLKVNDATPIIFATGRSVMALGGYSGYDPILTPTSLARLVKDGEVRFFLLPATNLTQKQVQTLYPDAAPQFQTSYTNQVTQWVSNTCVPVPPQQWKTQLTLGTTQLFDCANST